MMRSGFLRLRRLLAVAATLVSLAGGMSSAYADGVAPAAASPLEREQAQSLFLRGKERFDQKAFREALEAFRASLGVVNSPNTRLYVGRCLHETGDPLGAYVEFGRAAIEAREAAATDGRYKLTADEAAAERDGVQSELGFVTVRLNGADAATQLRIAGHRVRAPLSRGAAGGAGDTNAEAWPVLPGTVEVVVERDGADISRRTIKVARGARETVQIDVPPPPSPKAPARAAGGDDRTFRTLSLIAGGVGLAGMATFTVAGLQAKSTFDDLDMRCNGTRCREDVSSDISHGTTMQTIANVGLVVGVVGIAAGVTLFVVGESKRSSSSSSRAALSVITTGNGIAVRGAL
ncbi:hypothetical protein [Pendulispora albinea]|uniref:Tetratricopeptide repeat protein n=1 Tax=Pendulispora albinea TaxID=2741071 RepID=A0ABZ2LQT8_9BACT